MSAPARTAYPLSWPEHVARARCRERSRFDTTFASARQGLADELDRLKARDVILSTNVELRLDGQPYANRSEPSDPAVAVYFTYRGNPVCFACDRWDRVRDNIRAIQKTIEALRGIERWGATDMLERAFRGFAALPAPGSGSARDWRAVLGYDGTSPEGLRERYRRLRAVHHPDRGGDAGEFRELVRAYEQGMTALGAAP